MKALLSLFALLLSVSAFAQNHHGQTTIGGVLGPVMEGPWNTEPAKKALGIGGRLGAFARFNHDDPNAGFEVAVDAIELFRSPTGMKVFTLNFFRRYFVNSRFQPMWSAGVGASANHDWFGAGGQSTPAFRLRGGIEMALDPRTDVGFYLDHFTIFKSRSGEPDLQILAPAITFMYSFGDIKTADAPVAAASAPVVSPAPQKMANIDSDGDGVLDAADRCAGTAKGTEVNELGCAVNQAFDVALNVQFKKGTATLEAGDMADLKALADIMNKHSDLKLELQGYTDNKGNPAKNKALSSARANAVKNALVKEYKVDASRLTATGYGAESPVASNKTAEGRAKNRRVNAKVIR